MQDPAATPTPSPALSNNTAATRLATRLVFFIAGFGMACWAPLVPYAQARLKLDEGSLGLLLLCLGTGSVLSMLFAGGLTGRAGSRPVLIGGSLVFCLALPGLAAAGSFPLLAVSLGVFGAALGAIDVSANVHAVEVERDSAVPLMSAFHGFFSVGCFAGAGLMTLLLGKGMAPLTASCLAAGVILVLLAGAAPRLLRTRAGGSDPFFVRPRGIIRLLGVLAFIFFLTEGAMLDWSAVLLEKTRGFEKSDAGIGYALFALAMTAGRFAGDRAVARLGPRRMLLLGALTVAAGYVLLLASPWNAGALGGFLVMGLGISNLVPVLFSAAGRQTDMPGGLAIASVSMIGYAGILAGPAVIGFIADGIGLRLTFAAAGVLMIPVMLLAGKVAPPER